MVTVNGTEFSDLAGMTLSDFLESNNYHPERTVVELNHRIVSRKDYADTILHDNDLLEILTFVGGG
jgi:sulfur carrier protein